MTSRHLTTGKGVTAFVGGYRCTSWEVRVPKFGRFPFAALLCLPLSVFPGNLAYLCCRAGVRLFLWHLMGR